MEERSEWQEALEALAEAGMWLAEEMCRVIEAFGEAARAAAKELDEGIRALLRKERIYPEIRSRWKEKRKRRKGWRPYRAKQYQYIRILRPERAWIRNHV